MSKKSSHHRVAQRVENQAATIRAGTDAARGSIRTGDSFTNLGARLGYGAGSQQDGSRYQLDFISRNPYNLEAAYRSNWLCGMVVDVVAHDMTRAGIEFLSEDVSPDDAKTMHKEFERLDLWGGLCNGLKWGRLYGGGIVVLLVDGQNLSTPLRLDTVGEGQFKGVVALDRWQVNPTLHDLVTDYGPDLGKPKYYDVNPSAQALIGERIHYSRCIRIDGLDLPFRQKLAENGWGQSVLERLWDRIIAFDSTSEGAAQLVYKAHLRTIKIKDFRQMVAMGGPAFDGMVKQLQFMRSAQSNEGLSVIDAEDEFETHSYTFAGLSDMLMQFGQQLSGATQIPLVRLFGQSPAGLNSTGESDLRTYHDGIAQQQDQKLRPGVGKVLELVHRSTFGKPLPEGFEFAFAALLQMSDTEKATVAKTIAEAVTMAEGAGIITPATAAKELRQASRATGVFTHIDDDEITDLENEPPAPGDVGVDPETGKQATVDSSSEHWITLENGEHALINGAGEIIGGAGGNLNGKKLDNVKSKSAPVSGNKSTASESVAAKISTSLSGVKFKSGNAKHNLAALHKAVSGMGHSVSAEPMGNFISSPVAAVNPNTKHMRLNSQHPFWKDPEAFAPAMHESGISSGSHPHHVIAHELGHLAHHVPLDKHEFSSETEKSTAGKVSRYSMKNKNEFLAEYVAGTVSGQKFDTDVHDLYKSLIGEIGKGK